MWLMAVYRSTALTIKCGTLYYEAESDYHSPWLMQLLNTTRSWDLFEYIGLRADQVEENPA